MSALDRGHVKVVLAALGGAMIAVLAAVLVDPKPWLLESRAGQQMVQAFMDWRAPVTPGVPRVREGDAIRGLRVATVEGTPVSLDAHLGRGPTLINLWATWCAPCLKELPVLEAYARGRPAARVLAIAMDDRAQVANFLARRPSRIPQFWVPEPPAFAPGRLGNPAGVLPYSVLVDGEGRVLARRTGVFHDTGDIETWVRQSTQSR